MASFRGREDIESWLHGKPRRLSVAIAARAALRVVPLLPHNTPDLTSIALALFRGVSSAWVGAIYTPRALGPQVIRACEMAGHAIESAANRNNNDGVLHNVGFAAFAANNAVSDRSKRTTPGYHTSYAVDFAGKAITAAHLGEHELDVFFETTANEAARVEKVRADAGLGAFAMQPLWPLDSPDWVIPLWRRMKSGLLIEDNSWSVWTDWYESRLTGKQPAIAVELARVILKPEIWEKSPQEANAEIAALLKVRPADDDADTSRVAKQRPEVPNLRPAAIEPYWHNDRLTIPKSAVTTDLAEAKFAAALMALKTEFSEFVNEIAIEVNIDKRFIRFSQRLMERIPESPPPQDELFRLAHVEKVFAGYAKVVDEEWSSFLAARYHALLLQFNRTLRQSALWREFERNAAKETLTAEQIIGAAAVARAAADSLRIGEAHGFVDEAVPQSLEALADVAKTLSETETPQDAINAGMESLAIDILESVSNVVKPIAEVAVNSAGQYSEGFGKGFRKAAKAQGPKDGAAAFKWLRRVAIVALGGGAGTGSVLTFANLITKYPDIFEWLERVLQFIRHVG